jgi:hypothetical protein
METIIEITFNNKIEKIEKSSSECFTRFNERIKFIRLLESYNIIWKDALKLSKIWYNIIYYKMKYNKLLYNQIIKYNKLLKK